MSSIPLFFTVFSIVVLTLFSCPEYVCTTYHFKSLSSDIKIILSKLQNYLTIRLSIFDKPVSTSHTKTVDTTKTLSTTPVLLASSLFVGQVTFFNSCPVPFTNPTRSEERRVGKEC